MRMTGGRRRVVFVNRFFYPDHSATSQILSDLAFDLAASGMDVEVVTSRLLYGGVSRELAREEVVRGVRVSRVWTSRFGRSHLLGRALDYLSFYFSAARQLWRTVDKDTVLVAKTDPPLLSLMAAPVARLRGAVLVNWLQDVFPEVAASLNVRLIRGPLLRVLRKARNASLRSAGTNVVLGERMQQLLEAEGVPHARMRVIPNWADAGEIQPIAREANSLRAEWGLADRFVVGYSGNLGRAHEFTTFLDAAAALRERPEIVFLFIGGGAQFSELEDAAKRKQLDNVLFRPYQPRERLAESLGVSDVHLVSLNPALEGLIVPSKFYGIAAAGRPTLFVGDPDGEIPRILRRFDCGYAVQTGDAPTLAALIRRLADDKPLSGRLGHHARTALVDEFDRSRAVAAWKAVLSASAAQAPSGGTE